MADFIPNIIATNMFSMLTIKIPLGNFSFKLDSSLTFTLWISSSWHQIIKPVATLLTRSSKDTWGELENFRTQETCSTSLIRREKDVLNLLIISNKNIRHKQTYVRISEGKKCSFFRKFDVLFFLETPVLRFVLLPYYRRYDKTFWKNR